MNWMYIKRDNTATFKHKNKHSVKQKLFGLKFSKPKNWKLRDVLLPSQFVSFYFPYIRTLVTFLCLPFITINHTAYILTGNKNTFVHFKFKNLLNYI